MEPAGPKREDRGRQVEGGRDRGSGWSREREEERGKGRGREWGLREKTSERSGFVWEE